MNAIAISSKQELHSLILRLVLESDESLQKEVGEIKSVADLDRSASANRFSISDIWSDMLHIDLHLRTIARQELIHRKFNGPALEFTQ